MSAWVINHVPGMIKHQGQTVDRFGFDQTGTVDYHFNQQGFRSLTNFDFVPNYAFFGCSSVFGIGVAHQSVFSNMFDHAHNYGLAGDYNNDDVFMIIEQYLQSSAYSDATKKLVYWTDRNTQYLDRYSQQLSEQGFVQLFCGPKLPYKNCFVGFPSVDQDASGTHMGAKTHLTTYKLLCSVFNR